MSHRLPLHFHLRARLRRDPGKAFFGAVVVVLAAVTGLLVVSRPRQQPPGSAPAATPSPAPLPSCASLGSGTGICRDGSQVVTVVTGDKPVVLPDMQIRVLRMALTAGRIQARLRVRNATSSPQRFNADGQQAGLRIGKTMLRAVGPPAPSIPAQRAGSTTVTFALNAQQSAALHGPGARADLLVRGFNANSTKSGVVRLQTH